MKLFAFHCGGEVTDMAVFDPFDPSVGHKLAMPYFFYVIQHPEGTVLFDTGIHPSVREAPAEHMGEAPEPSTGNLPFGRGTTSGASSPR